MLIAGIGILTANAVCYLTGAHSGLSEPILAALVICIVLAFASIKMATGHDKVSDPDALAENKR